MTPHIYQGSYWLSSNIEMPWKCFIKSLKGSLISQNSTFSAFGFRSLGRRREAGGRGRTGGEKRRKEQEPCWWKNIVHEWTGLKVKGHSGADRRRKSRGLENGTSPPLPLPLEDFSLQTVWKFWAQGEQVEEPGGQEVNFSCGVELWVGWGWSCFGQHAGCAGMGLVGGADV